LNGNSVEQLEKPVLHGCGYGTWYGYRIRHFL